MNRKEFDSLDIIRQIDYINKELSNGKSLTELSEKINISRSTIRKRFKKLGYLFDQDANKYLCDKEVKNVTPGNKPIENNESDKNNIKITYDNKDIEKLALKADSILGMLTWWENRDVKNNIDISRLNSCSPKTETRSFNVNKEVLNSFVSYCKRHKEYRQIDLISIALLDFLEKYK
ncbi:HTH domain-containing protein [Clostridium phage CWou-2020a]|uniref:Uncharacterized protein n=1 Tax=Clostridium botulinum C/D str. DC5 TaxID=1443128 RepID=A0A0A0I442_CLOBO|nr:HTH domain-containing protein [Clostridium botulinum]QPW59450.1 HTH domain-containing protein [Clostridium phage CWou-2020a]KGM95577.1 hypothetical protein Z955_14040 [Clostridium botulinum C/D str. DC5]KOC54164.1 hypothetical protein ADU90_12535 [Clostridium botulinum]KOC56508.1 hypothetical protein ADU89_02545 [Clostridium botulinum]MCD3241342.1 HTH domain-containing protein [Clostridium botulinum D/C]